MGCSRRGHNKKQHNTDNPGGYSRIREKQGDRKHDHSDTKGAALVAAWVRM
jgi:hypothetical protein